MNGSPDANLDEAIPEGDQSGIINDEGSMNHVISLEELARVGCSQPLHMHSYANFGEVKYEFIISDAENVSNKVAYLREQQKKQ